MFLNNESNKIVNQQCVYSIAGNLKRPNIYCQYVENLENLFEEKKDLKAKLNKCSNKDTYNKINLNYNINLNNISENIDKFGELLNNEIISYMDKLKTLYKQNYYGDELFKIIRSNCKKPNIDIEKNICSIKQYPNKYFEDLYKKELQKLMFDFKHDKKYEEIFIDLKKTFNYLDGLNMHNKLEQKNEYIKNNLLNLIISNENLNENDLKIISNFLNAHKIIEKNTFNQIINKNKPANFNNTRKKQLNKIKEENEENEENEEEPVDEAFLKQLEEDAKKLGPYVENFIEQNNILKEENAKLKKENKNLKNIIMQLKSSNNEKEKELIKARKLIDELLNNSATLNKSYNKDANIKKNQGSSQKFDQSYNRSSKK